MKAFLVAAVLATPAAAESLCGRTDTDAVLAELAGRWSGEVRFSAVNEIFDELRRTPADRAEPTILSADGTMLAMQDLLPEAHHAMRLAVTEPLDVDMVDDLLETADAEDFADALSDTPCGPEALPQFAAPVSLSDPAGMTATGRVILVPYFTDRVLRFDRVTFSDGVVVLYMTRAHLLTRLAD